MRIPKPARRSPKPRKRVRRTKRGGKAWAARECDRIWGELVRAKNDGVCWLLGRTDGHTCKGPIQAAHGFSRRYRATRWLTVNGFPLCAGGHLKYTYDSVSWNWWLGQWWGEQRFEQLRVQAMLGAKVDPYWALEQLRAEQSCA